MIKFDGKFFVSGRHLLKAAKQDENGNVVEEPRAIATFFDSMTEEQMEKIGDDLNAAYDKELMDKIIVAEIEAREA